MIVCGPGSNGIPPAQESADRFYWEKGPCCAGCDHWSHLATRIGECTKAAPVSAADRAAAFGMESLSINIGSGHPLTPREHRCGDFKDEFDWSTLPLAYRKRVGAPISEGNHHA